jgi:hypothetical protein
VYNILSKGLNININGEVNHARKNCSLWNYGKDGKHTEMFA